MQKITFLIILYLGWMFSPISIFAGGNKDRCDLTIENKTGAHITQIIIEDSESNYEPQIFVINVMNNASTTLKLSKNIFYNIILLDTNERQYIQKSQIWNENTASCIFRSHLNTKYGLFERQNGNI